ncbi:MAG: glycosyltransferase [Candidatus Cloacimonetes bacterium]|nr:glycosyltransferase [Candidatus Cloacimonadota bacterium]
MRIVIFIGTLQSGGKERRLIELLSYLKGNTDFEMLLVLRQELIDYPAFCKLNIPYKLLTKKYRKGDISLHYMFYRICKSFKPDLIHTWGSMPAFVSLMAVIMQGIPHINSQITSAPPKINKCSLEYFINRISFHFSEVILSNSYAGIESYNPPRKKCKVIYNGINLARFEGLPSAKSCKTKYGIETAFAVVMVASFTNNKDFDCFIRIANIVTARRIDVSFVCIGGQGNDSSQFDRAQQSAKDNPRIIITGRISEVEALVNACDIGVLLSNRAIHGEGISNTITEYMALKKPVIANNAGGTREIVQNGHNGYLITTEDDIDIAELIMNLLDDSDLRTIMGERGRKTIEETFVIDKMGSTFVEVYKTIAKLA